VHGGHADKRYDAAIRPSEKTVREGLRFVEMPELLIPRPMLAVVGPLSFNFPTVMPLFGCVINRPAMPASP